LLDEQLTPLERNAWQRSLTLAAHQLREAGFRQMRASSLKGKHFEALLQR
jgi:hypothetical protein